MGHFRPAWPPVCNPTPRPPPVAVRSAAGSRSCGTRALSTVLAGASPEAGVVAGPVRLLVIRSSGLVGWGVCVAGLGAVRPRGWPSGRWMGGARGMGYRGGAGPGPAPPLSLSGAVCGGDLVRGLGDHVGLAGDAELAESGQDPGLDERAEQLFAVPHVGHAQNAVAERGDVKAHPGGHVAVPADSLAERVVLVGRNAVPLLHDDGGHDFPPDGDVVVVAGETGIKGQRVAEHAAAWPAAGQRADECGAQG